jgi:hypothetical protein
MSIVADRDSAKPSTPDGAPSTRLSGWRLLAVRLAWLLVLIVTLALFAVKLPAYLSNVEHTAPENAALSPGAVQALAQAGVALVAFSWISFGILCVVVLASLALALTLAWRRNDDWMALLVSLFLVNYTISTIGLPTNASSTPSASLAQLALIVAQTVPGFAITFAVFLLFPDGRFTPRWSWLILAATTIWLIIVTLQPNLFGNALFLGYPVAVGAAIACMIYRYRRASTTAQRQQTKWIVVGLVITLLVNQLFWLPTGFTSLGQTLYAPLLFTVFQIVQLLTPITFFIAIQRYRLYDIDTIINRALVYGSLTAVLVGIYAVSIIEAQALMDAITHHAGEKLPLVIVATTLLIAALFRPLRNRLQALVDRRFYRSKYDAAKTVAAFGATLRQEVELGALQTHLLDAVEQTMQPTHASVWLSSQRHAPRPVETHIDVPQRL